MRLRQCTSSVGFSQSVPGILFLPYGLSASIFVWGTLTDNCGFFVDNNFVTQIVRHRHSLLLIYYGCYTIIKRLCYWTHKCVIMLGLEVVLFFHVCCPLGDYLNKDMTFFSKNKNTFMVYIWSFPTVVIPWSHFSFYSCSQPQTDLLCILTG